MSLFKRALGQGAHRKPYEGKHRMGVKRVEAGKHRG